MYLVTGPQNSHQRFLSRAVFETQGEARESSPVHTTGQEPRDAEEGYLWDVACFEGVASVHSVAAPQFIRHLLLVLL